jgi:Fe-S-cluster containining protein
MLASLPVINLAEARFECTFGRGCEGICCREGRPMLYPDEIERLDSARDRFLAHLRPAAKAALEKQGYVSGQKRLGLPTVRTVDGWCLFFNGGCVLHKIGEAEGDRYRYKPAACALFPLARDENDRWYVRQHGYKGEKWDLFCLAGTCATPASQSLASEVALAVHYDREQAASEDRQAS